MIREQHGARASNETTERREKSNNNRTRTRTPTRLFVRLAAVPSTPTPNIPDLDYLSRGALSRGALLPYMLHCYCCVLDVEVAGVSEPSLAATESASKNTCDASCSNMYLPVCHQRVSGCAPPSHSTSCHAATATPPHLDVPVGFLFLTTATLLTAISASNAAFHALKLSTVTGVPFARCCATSALIIR